MRYEDKEGIELPYPVLGHQGTPREAMYHLWGPGGYLRKLPALLAKRLKEVEEGGRGRARKGAKGRPRKLALRISLPIT